MPHARPDVPSARDAHPGPRFSATPPECRAEDGLYFADGRVVLLEVADDVVHVHETTTLAEVCDDAPDDWIGLEAMASVAAEDYVVSGGGTDWEAEGWVALQAAADGGLVWLVKLEGVDAVNEVRRDGDAIVARSEAYPFVVEWLIPIDDPEQMTIERRRMNESMFREPRAEA